MNLLEQVTHDILEQYGPFNLGRLTLVFPTRRAGMMITESLRKSLEKQNIRRPMLAPEINSDYLDEFSTCISRKNDINNKNEYYLLCIKIPPAFYINVIRHGGISIPSKK